MDDLGELLEQSVANHGHLCPGQVRGVRLAMLGCREVGIDDPKSSRNLIAYGEIGRCATDAIQSVTGCKLGKRTLKFMDYGNMAAALYNLRENRAVRVLARDDSRDRAKESQTQAYIEMEDSDLFVVTPVRAKLRQEGLPGIHSAVLAVTNAVSESTTREKWLLMIGLFVSPAQMEPIT